MALKQKPDHERAGPHLIGMVFVPVRSFKSELHQVVIEKGPTYSVASFWNHQGVSGPIISTSALNTVSNVEHLTWREVRRHARGGRLWPQGQVPPRESISKAPTVWERLAGTAGGHEWSYCGSLRAAKHVVVDVWRCGRCGLSVAVENSEMPDEYCKRILHNARCEGLLAKATPEGSCQSQNGNAVDLSD